MTKVLKKFEKKLPPIVYQVENGSKSKSFITEENLWTLLKIIGVIVLLIVLVLLVSCSSSKSAQAINKAENDVRVARLYGEKHLIDKNEKPKLILKTHVTPLELLTYNHKTTKMFVAFINDDRIYTLSSNNVHFDEYRDLLTKQTFSDVFFEVKTYKDEIISINEVEEESQKNLKERFLDNYLTNKEKTQEDQNKRLAVWMVVPSIENSSENTLSLNEINNAYQVCKEEIQFSESPTSVRSVLYDNLISEKTGVNSYKLVVLPLVQDVKPLTLQHKFFNEKKAWLFLNVYKEIKEVVSEDNTKYHQVSWWVVDPYFFNKPILLNEAIRDIEWQSEQKVNYFIANQTAFGYNHRDNIVLYK